MLIAGFPAGPWAANCYLVGTGPGSECVVIDPGMDAVPGVDALVAEHDLTPVAVLLTHGHLDHLWSATPVADAHGVPVLIHHGDRHLLADPMAGMPPGTAQMLGDVDLSFSEPRAVRELADREQLDLAGLTFTVDHTPGHTPGSVCFRTPYGEQGVSEVLFSGDLLFAGSIGRTDLPGGDHPTILRTLADKILPLADDVVVLPGHGEQTTIAQERATNPFLQDLPATDASPARGV